MLQYFFVLAALVFVLLTSCPVKNSIKNWGGKPVNSLMVTGINTHNLISNQAEKSSFCTTTGKVSAVLGVSLLEANNILPAVLFTAVLFFLLRYAIFDKQSYRRLGSTKIASTVPIFLQYRKLII